MDGRSRTVGTSAYIMNSSKTVSTVLQNALHDSMDSFQNAIESILLA